MENKRNSQINSFFAKKLFGSIPDGEEIYSYELSNANGMSFKVITYGATLTELKVPLKDGGIIDVVLGFDTVEDYIQSFQLTSGAPYIGATVGRYAGRIHNSSFELNGQKILLNKNNNANSLHGGIVGFSQKVWKVKEETLGKAASITLVYTSPANEENYPGDLTVEVTYSLSETNELHINYSAKTTEETVVNLTNHSYFNLEGHFSNLENQELLVNTNQILETTDELIPTGRYIKVENTEFDFLTPKKCPAKIDNSFVLTQKEEIAATLFSKKNNLKMNVITDQPSVHIYVGGNCGIIKGKENAYYHALSGICFETQNFPDAPNQEHFPSPFLKKGEEYTHATIYQFESF